MQPVPRARPWSSSCAGREQHWDPWARPSCGASSSSSLRRYWGPWPWAWDRASCGRCQQRSTWAWASRRMQMQMQGCGRRQPQHHDFRSRRASSSCSACPGRANEGASSGCRATKHRLRHPFWNTETANGTRGQSRRAADVYRRTRPADTGTSRKRHVWAARETLLARLNVWRERLFGVRLAKASTSTPRPRVHDRPRRPARRRKWRCTTQGRRQAAHDDGVCTAVNPALDSRGVRDGGDAGTRVMDEKDGQTAADGTWRRVQEEKADGSRGLRV